MVQFLGSIIPGDEQVKTIMESKQQMPAVTEIHITDVDLTSYDELLQEEVCQC
jgi:hypothetical protein